jgi:hypothetical protein
MGKPDDLDFYDEAEMFPCPHCSGFGTVDCHCGGDLCVCENYGEAVCKVCHGEGEVTEDRYDLYEEAQRRNHQSLAALLAKEPTP